MHNSAWLTVTITSDLLEPATSTLQMPFRSRKMNREARDFGGIVDYGEVVRAAVSSQTPHARAAQPFPFVGLNHSGTPDTGIGPQEQHKQGNTNGGVYVPCSPLRLFRHVRNTSLGVLFDALQVGMACFGGPLLSPPRHQAKYPKRRN